MRQDNIFLGIGVALFFFVAFLFGLYQLNDALIGKQVFGNTFIGFRERFMAILAVFSNILPFAVYLSAKKYEAMRGVGIVTVLLVLGVVIYYFILYK